jgi:hypothetical protein
VIIDALKLLGRRPHRSTEMRWTAAVAGSRALAGGDGRVERAEILADQG